MNNPEANNIQNEANEAYERWKVLYPDMGDELVEETAPDNSNKNDNDLTVEMVRESINEGRRKAGLKEITDFKDYPLDQANEAGQTTESNELEIGEININGIKQEFVDFKAERVEELAKKLDDITPKLAELYARNRNLFVGAKNRSDFVDAQGEYGKLLDEYLKLQATEEFENGKHEIGDKLEARIAELTAKVEADLNEFIADEENPKSQEELDAKKEELVKEAEEILNREYADMINELGGKVNANFLTNYIEEAKMLEEATIDALDNGTLCRKVVNKVINNKYLKTGLLAAAAAGIIATGVGVAVGLGAGTMSIGLGYTAGGVALGAGKGALMGTIMSRQNSQNSAIRNLHNEEDIKSGLKEIDILDSGDNAKNVADYLLDQFNDANAADRASNKKKTLISAGIGAALGALTSGVKVDNIVKPETPENVSLGTEPIKYEFNPDVLEQVDVPKNHGFYTTFQQMGGDLENVEQATDIMVEVGKKYGFERVNNQLVVDGPFAHTHPGKIADWPGNAQSFITEVAKAWAEKGLISADITGGQEIFDTVTKASIEYVPSAFGEFIRNGVTLATTGAIAGAFGDEEVKPLPKAEPEAEPKTEPEAEPEAPVDTAETTPEESAEEAQEESQEESSEADKKELTVADRVNQLVESYSNILPEGLGDGGAELVTTTEALSPDLAERFAAYWGGLNDRQKRFIKLVQDRLDGNPDGAAFREWLSQQTQN